MKCNRTLAAACILAIVFFQPAFADPVRKITIDGNFADWADVPAHKDLARNEHDTSHSKRDDAPVHVEHADVDILEYKLAHDEENLYAYFKARGVIGRTQVGDKGKPAGRIGDDQPVNGNRAARQRHRPGGGAEPAHDQIASQQRGVRHGQPPHAEPAHFDGGIGHRQLSTGDPDRAGRPGSAAGHQIR